MNLFVKYEFGEEISDKRFETCLRKEKGYMYEK